MLDRNRFLHHQALMGHHRAGHKSHFGSDITQPYYLLEKPGTKAENPGAVSGENFETYQAGGATDPCSGQTNPGGHRFT